MNLLSIVCNHDKKWMAFLIFFPLNAAERAMQNIQSPCWEHEKITIVHEPAVPPCDACCGARIAGIYCSVACALTQGCTWCGCAAVAGGAFCLYTARRRSYISTVAIMRPVRDAPGVQKMGGFGTATGSCR